MMMIKELFDDWQMVTASLISDTAMQKLYIDKIHYNFQNVALMNIFSKTSEPFTNYI